MLIAPHDPLPLVAQIEQRTPGLFTVDYLERGPAGLAAPVRPRSLTAPLPSRITQGRYPLVDAAYETPLPAVSTNLHPSRFDEISPKVLATATVAAGREECPSGWSMPAWASSRPRRGRCAPPGPPDAGARPVRPRSWPGPEIAAGCGSASGSASAVGRTSSGPVARAGPPRTSPSGSGNGCVLRRASRRIWSSWTRTRALPVAQRRPTSRRRRSASSSSWGDRPGTTRQRPAATTGAEVQVDAPTVGRAVAPGTKITRGPGPQRLRCHQNPPPPPGGQFRPSLAAMCPPFAVGSAWR